ncbi:hypothetical protein OG782_31110 [Streptomyces sp. NBC_00876]|uniref:hypothetical protein n=1 Tax=Streptomyces sp. NBC_00876 TaxID=2975853 RepID=UPI0038643BBA|nr:hypothetical protein OG782_31110 [Streptomyces sp. NBC_00876]
MTDIDYSTTGSAVNQWQYSGTWPSGGGNTWDDTDGATAKLTFRGDGVALRSMTNSSNGIVKVSVDGGPPTEVDLYSAGGGLTPVFTRTGLDPAEQHTMVVTVTGTRNAASRGTFAGALVTVPGKPAPTPVIIGPADGSTIHPGRVRIEGTATAGELIPASGGAGGPYGIVPFAEGMGAGLSVKTPTRVLELTCRWRSVHPSVRPIRSVTC